MLAPPALKPLPPDRQVTLYIPGLFAEPAGPHALRRLLARADRLPGGGDGAIERLFALFSIAPDKNQDLAIAAITRVADMGVIDHEWWIRADPVHLEPGRDSLMLRSGLDLTQEEAAQLVAELNESLSQDGWLLKAPRPHRWYLKPPAAPSIRTTPLNAVIGRDIHPHLPQGDDYKTWHTRLNEIQILLHTSPVNAAREARGALPANSVWFWGGGRLPRPGTVHWTQLWGDTALAQGLARLTGVANQPVPVNGTQLLSQPINGEHLIVLEQHMVNDAEAFQLLAQDWLAPLIAGVHKKQFDSLSLISDTGPMLIYRKGHRWRVWRRTKAVAVRQKERT